MEKEKFYTSVTINTDGVDNYGLYNTNNTYSFNCQYLLPCGLCRLTNQQCPKAWDTPNKWWEKVTCKTIDD